MIVDCRKKSSLRKNSGSVIAEFGAAFPILLTGIFIPMIALMSVFSLYSAADCLNKAQCEQASLLNYAIAQNPLGPVKKSLPETWMSSGIGAYAEPVLGISTDIDYSFAYQDEYNFIHRWVEVTTRLRIKPFLSADYFPLQIPALNAPFPVAFHTRRLLEDPTNAPPL
ncbi:MAG: hypothetical protein K2X27_16925 [Candidatus Obscuribacterales bacterium]|nr:hypothetical protein [Candidatus Obscuribacterales bacterium]